MNNGLRGFPLAVLQPRALGYPLGVSLRPRPEIQEVALSGSSAGSGAHSLTLPIAETGGKRLKAGDLLIAGAIFWANGTVSFPTGWSIMASGTNQGVAYAFHFCNGSEGTTITLSNPAGAFAGVCVRVRGADVPKFSSLATDTDAMPSVALDQGRPPLPYLWLPIQGAQGGTTTNPPGFISLGQASGGDGNTSMMAAYRHETSQTSPSGSWTTTGATERGIQIVIPPAGSTIS